VTIRILTLITSVMLLGVSHAAADTVYTYTGNDFTVATSPFTTSDSVTGSFTVATPLGDNLVDSPIVPSSFSFSDGVDTITSATPDATVENFDVYTSPSGAIIYWQITLEVTSSPSYFLYTESFASIGQDEGAGSSSYGYNQGHPGTWTSAAAVPLHPLPLPLQLIAIGLGALGLFGLPRKNAAVITDA
jgi:hypothetical protein